MYRVTALTRGKYGNTRPGPRYCLTRKSAKELAKLFIREDIETTVEKFIHVTGDVFAWSDYEGYIGFDIDDLLDKDTSG